MPAKSRSDSSQPTARASSRPRATRLRRRAAILAIATALATAIAAGPNVAASLADTGSVYFDVHSNVAAGHNLFNGTFTGFGNVGLGDPVMPNLTSGGVNTASGFDALASNTSGDRNVATGADALAFNTTGSFNLAAGEEALFSNLSGDNNVATGGLALTSNNTGHDNVASGFEALRNTSGSSNTALGSGAGSNLTNGSNNLDIANAGKAGESRVIRIGTNGTQRRAFLAGVSGKSIPGPTQAVRINANGELGTATAASKRKGVAPSGSLARKLKRQETQNRRQSNEIATLKREVARLSRG